MSITLEGNVVAEDDERNWSGLWRFTKEKKSFLSFGFKVGMMRRRQAVVHIANQFLLFFLQQEGLVVPRDLFDYVSFANEPLSALTPVPPGRKAKDSKSKLKNKPGKGGPKIVRGRGRPPSISEPPKFMLAAASAGANDQKLESQAVENAENTAADKDQQHDQADGERDGEGEDRDGASHREDEQNEHSDSDEDRPVHEQDEQEDHEHLNTSMDVEPQHSSSQNPQSQEHEAHNEGGASQTQEGTSTTPAKPTAPLGPDVELDGTHPMIGLWEGSFNVKVPTGTHVYCHTVVVTLVGGLQLLVGAPVPLYLLCVFTSATPRFKNVWRVPVPVYLLTPTISNVDYCLNTAPCYARHRRRGGDGEVLLLRRAEYHLLHRRYFVAFVHRSVPKLVCLVPAFGLST
jgi:hypothetical protein